jgi:hypothetical protein
MKLKSDFITNSSSTIYMVIFPSKKPEITAKDIAKHVCGNIPSSERNNKKFSEYVYLNKIIVEDIIDDMFKNYSSMYQEELEDIIHKKYSDQITKLENTFDCFFFSTVIDVLYEKHCIVDTQSISGEGSTMIIVLDRERVLEILKDEIQT